MFFRQSPVGVATFTKFTNLHKDGNTMSAKPCSIEKCVQERDLAVATPTSSMDRSLGSNPCHAIDYLLDLFYFDSNPFAS